MAKSSPPPVGLWGTVRPYLKRIVPALLIGYWGALFVATHVPMPKSETQVNDKALHIVAYAILAFLFAWVISPKRRLTATWLIVVLACAVYGLLDELLQRSVPSRHADVWDFYADVVGAMIGATAFLVLQRIWRDRRIAKDLPC